MSAFLQFLDNRSRVVLVVLTLFFWDSKPFTPSIVLSVWTNSTTPAALSSWMRAFRTVIINRTNRSSVTIFS